MYLLVTVDWRPVVDVTTLIELEDGREVLGLFMVVLGMLLASLVTDPNSKKPQTAFLATGLGLFVMVLCVGATGAAIWLPSAWNFAGDHCGGTTSVPLPHAHPDL